MPLSASEDYPGKSTGCRLRAVAEIACPARWRQVVPGFSRHRRPVPAKAADCVAHAPSARLRRMSGRPGLYAASYHPPKLTPRMKKPSGVPRVARASRLPYFASRGIHPDTQGNLVAGGRPPGAARDARHGRRDARATQDSPSRSQSDGLWKMVSDGIPGELAEEHSWAR